MKTGTWTTKGFDAFSRGTLGNAGQNLYVSRRGVLQRIHQFSLTGSGYVDLVYCNSQDHWERPPAYVYHDPLGQCTRTDLPAEGAMCAAMADLNGDGRDDLAMGFVKNGIHPELSAYIYFSSPEGLSEQYRQQLPAPVATAVAAGDFNGDGKCDLAFITQGKLLLFYQTDLGFEPKRFTDLSIAGADLAAADLDGDGCAELIVRGMAGDVTIYWGSPHGLAIDRKTTIAEATTPPENKGKTQSAEEEVADAGALVGVVNIRGMPHIFVARPEHALLVPIGRNRVAGKPLMFECANAMAAAVGDVNGDGHADIVLACREKAGDGERSWIYWGAEDGYRPDRRTAIPTSRACDVAVGDLNGDGCADIVICQNRTADDFTTCSLIFRGSRSGIDSQPVPLVSHDARRCFIGRTCDKASPQVVLVNYFAGTAHDRIPSYIYTGGPDGYRADRRIEVAGSGTYRALCADFNDDGYVDLLLNNGSEMQPLKGPGAFLYLNGPKGLPKQPSTIFPGRTITDACCADIDRDGYLELILAGFYDPELLIFRDGPNGFDLQNPRKILIEEGKLLSKDSRGLLLADLNNNGWLDLVVSDVTSDHSYILWGGPEGFSLERSQTLSVVRGRYATAADLDGDGYLELIIGAHKPLLTGPHDCFIYIYWNGPDGLREDRRTLLPAYSANGLAVADFNRDGVLDLFACSYSSSRVRDLDSYIYWNRAGRGFAADDFTRLFMHSAAGCIAADFNEDGWIDLAVANHKVWGSHRGDSMVWWNGPDGFDEKHITRLPTIGPHGMMEVGPGNIADRGPEEHYISEPFEMPPGAVVGRIAWQAQTPAKTWVRAQLRFAARREDLARAPWGENYDNGASIASTPSGRWVQYRLALGATNSVATPRITCVDVTYSLPS